MGTINSFQSLLDNIFLPLYEVTIDPASHPQLHVFLEQVSGNICIIHRMGAFHLIISPILKWTIFIILGSSYNYLFCTNILQVVGLDLVDDESKPERRPTKHMPTPEQWTNVFNPAYAYYVYYCYANLYTLNKVNILHGNLPALS